MEARSDAINVCESTVDQISQSEIAMITETTNDEVEQIAVVQNPAIKLENLPMSLIHLIMDSLPTKESTKFSVLSKFFNCSWLSYPILDFDNSLFPLDQDDPYAFFSFVNRILHLRGPHIQHCLRKLRLSFKVNLIYYSLYDFQPFLTQLLNFASLNNCKVLDLEADITVPGPGIWTRRSHFVNLTYNALLPLFSSEFLTTLKLSGFNVQISHPVIACPVLNLLCIRTCEGLKTLYVVCPSLTQVEIICCNGLERIIVDSDMIESFKFVGVRGNNGIKPCDITMLLDVNQCLKFMYLDNARVSEELMGVATQILYVFHCDMPQNMRIYNPYVKILEVKNPHHVENLVVCAPNVECLEFRASRGQRPCVIDISACVCLTVLVLKGAIITDDWLKRMMSILGCLEDLSLVSCQMLEKIEFKHEKLETLTVNGCSRLKEAMVDARNLLEFTYNGSVEIYPLLILSAKCNANITVKNKNSDDVWFTHLCRFLSCFDHFKVLTISCHSAAELIFSREFMWKNEVSPLHDVKFLKVKAKEMAMGDAMTSLVESLLWLVPKPDILTLESTSTGTKSILKFEYLRSFKQGEEEEEKCCIGVPIKCWKHSELIIEIDGFDPDEKDRLSNFFAPYL